MKLILNNEVKLLVLNSTETKNIDEKFWVLIIEAQGNISSEQIDSLVKDNHLINTIIKDEENNEKNLSAYELIGSIRITHGDIFTENIIRIKLKLGE